MSNILEFFVKMKDLASSGLVKMASTAQNSFNKVQSHVDKVTGKNKLLSSSYDEITAKIRQTERAISSSRIPSQIREAKNQLQELQRMQNRHTGNTSGGSSGGGGWLSQLMPAMGVAGVMALGGVALQSGLQAQARQASFEVMAGKTEGTRLNKDLGKYAQDSIYGNEVYQNAQTMMGFGINSKEVMPDLKMLGDVAMGDANKLNSLTLAFSQVSAGGKLTGQDMLQFVNAGFNPLNEIVKMTGMSMGDLKKAMENGAISAEMVKGAFQHATSEGGQFHKMADTIANTDFGKWQAFQGQLDALNMKIGGVLAPILGNLITNYLTPFLSILQDVGTWIMQNSSWITVLVGTLGTLAVGIGGVVIAQNLWTSAVAAFNAVMLLNPYVLIAAGLIAVGVGIAIAWNKFEGFRKVVLGSFNVLKTFFMGLYEFIKGLHYALTFQFDKAKESFTKAYELGKGLGTAYAEGAKEGIAKVNVKTEFGKNDKVGVFGAMLGAKQHDTLIGNHLKYSSVKATDSKTELSGTFDNLKNFKGKGKGSGSGTDAVSGITSGGPRVVNINGVKFADKIEFHVANMKEGADEAIQTFEDMFLRVLNSGASLQ